MLSFCVARIVESLINENNQFTPFKLIISNKIRNREKLYIGVESVNISDQQLIPSLGLLKTMTAQSILFVFSFTTTWFVIHELHDSEREKWPCYQTSSFGIEKSILHLVLDLLISRLQIGAHNISQRKLQ